MDIITIAIIIAIIAIFSLLLLGLLQNPVTPLTITTKDYFTTTMQEAPFHGCGARVWRPLFVQTTCKSAQVVSTVPSITTWVKVRRTPSPLHRLLTVNFCVLFSPLNTFTFTDTCYSPIHGTIARRPVEGGTSGPAGAVIAITIAEPPPPSTHQPLKIKIK